MGLGYHGLQGTFTMVFWFISIFSPVLLNSMSSSFYKKVFLPGVKLLKSMKVGPKYVLLSQWDFLRKKIYPYKKTSSNNQAGMSLIFPTKPVFIFSKQNWYVSSKDILYFLQEHFVILHYKDHLKRRCSNNQVRGKLSYFLPKFSHERSSKLEMFISTTQ